MFKKGDRVQSISTGEVFKVVDYSPDNRVEVVGIGGERAVFEQNMLKLLRFDK